jgi:ABC-2 type transport system ATP-binding protein
MTGNGTILELKRIRKHFGDVEALKGVDLKVKAGEFFGLLGPNGAGKSTLMKILSGFLAADTGEVQIKGRVVEFHDHVARRSCGLVPQEVALYDSLNPLENLRVFGDLYGLSRKEIHARGEPLLREVGLWERRKDRVKDFSGGMKRRLNIIVSLLHQPDILLCDEPTVGVDPQSRNAIFAFLESLNRSGLTILYTTHYMEEVERLCPRLAIIDHGNILACGTKVELLAEGGIRREILIFKGPNLKPLLAEAGRQGEVIEEERLFRLIPGNDLRLSELYQVAERSGLSYDTLQVRMPSMETLFLKLTGHSLRE